MSTHSGENQEQLCETIHRFSSSLEYLEVNGCHDPFLCDIPSLPLDIPRLSRIHLSLGNPKPQNVARLLQCATSLRELTLHNVLTLGDDEILTVLGNGVGSKLRSLSVSVWQGFRTRPGIYNLPCAILDACPRLTHFAYRTSCSSELFAHLPSTLRSLELIVSAPGAHPSPVDSPRVLLEYLASPRSAHLQRLQLVRRETAGERDAASWERVADLVRAACKERGVNVVWETA
ncbi:hypothetical protein PLICRDRAFT_44995 [Plicaturopsis crispa FD-325 SS-3]|nr:hypothetical protein PLICRDRAFT_44995 [Plicaturopsis crispa FD-325 SS-3]